MRYFLLSLVLLFLIGCSSNEPRVVTNYVTVNYNIPSKLLKNCELSRPVSKTAYMEMTPEEREKTLVKHIVNIYSEVSGCNDLMEELRNYIKDKESTR